MQSKNQPTAAQKRWREEVRALGSVISGAPAVIHHPVGCSGKHNKVEIGHWWVIPLSDEEHKALHNGETFGYESRKEFEKAAFDSVLNTAAIHFDSDGPDWDVRNAISDYRK